MFVSFSSSDVGARITIIIIIMHSELRVVYSAPAGLTPTAPAGR